MGPEGVPLPWWLVELVPCPEMTGLVDVAVVVAVSGDDDRGAGSPFWVMMRPMAAMSTMPRIVPGKISSFLSIQPVYRPNPKRKYRLWSRVPSPGVEPGLGV